MPALTPSIGPQVSAESSASVVTTMTKARKAAHMSHVTRAGCEGQPQQVPPDNAWMLFNDRLSSDVIAFIPTIANGILAPHGANEPNANAILAAQLRDVCTRSSTLAFNPSSKCDARQRLAKLLPPLKRSSLSAEARGHLWCI